MPHHLYLIRHGETPWSLAGRHSSHTEQPLTALGEAAACALGTTLRATPFAHVLVSPRVRALRTCALVGLSPAAVIEPDLTEWDYGDDEGLLSSEIFRARPLWSLFHDGCPHGETPAQITQRADRLLARLRLLAGNVALFTHGHFGRVLAVRWLGLPVAEARQFFLSPASFSILGYEHTDEPALLRWNQAASDEFDELRFPLRDDSAPAKLRALDRWENEGGEIPHVYPCDSAAMATTAANPPPMDRWPTAW